MNVKNDSTPVPSGATAIAAIIERREGLLSRAVSAQMFSRILMSDLEDCLDHRRAKVDGDGVITFRTRQENIDTTLWMMSELWSATHDAAKLVDELMDGVADLMEGAK